MGEHDWEYHESADGGIYYSCKDKDCDEVLFEFHDSYGGG